MEEKHDAESDLPLSMTQRLQSSDSAANTSLGRIRTPSVWSHQSNHNLLWRISSFVRRKERSKKNGVKAHVQLDHSKAAAVAGGTFNGAEMCSNGQASEQTMVCFKKLCLKNDTMGCTIVNQSGCALEQLWRQQSQMNNKELTKEEVFNNHAQWIV